MIGLSAKKIHLSVRATSWEQRARWERACAQATLDTGKKVELSTITRELLDEWANEILGGKNG